MSDRSRCLSADVALVLISETVRFWSDEQHGLLGETIPPRCMDAKRRAELRQALIEIDGYCKSGIRAHGLKVEAA